MEINPFLFQTQSCFIFDLHIFLLDDCHSLLPLIILPPKDRIILNCWKPYMHLLVSYFILFPLTFFPQFLILLVLISFGKSPSVDVRTCWFGSCCKTFKASTCFIPWFSMCILVFSNVFPKGVCVNLFYQSSLIRRWYFFSCKIFIIINFSRW